ncbi:DUF6301 family protein [Nocardia sp. NPDC058705]|uniref:DUF6301 family protein n=1 Tax=Nocardia sp. NPDC058705 TaxID=3346609 RepID=UPI003682FEC6
MSVDIPGAMRVATAAAAFDWTWSAGDIARFAASLGWGEPGFDDEDPSVIMMVTDLAHGDNVAMFGIDDDGEISLGAVFLAELPSRRTKAALAEVVAHMVRSWGPPTSPAQADGSGAAWVLPRVVVKVSGGKTVELTVQNPARWQAPQPEQDQYSVEELATAGSGFLEYLLTVIGANLGDRLEAENERSKLRKVFGRRSRRGTWSRRDIDEILRTFPTPPKPMGEGSLMASHDDKVGLIAAKTYDDQQQYGYGEFCEVRLFEFVPPAAADIVYARALRICIERLGDPHLVGGPNAFAMWRFDHDTIKLTRTQNSDSRLQVSRKPSEPSEWEQSANPYWDPDMEPQDIWRAVSDLQYSGEALEGILFDPGDKAKNWGELYTMLCAAFGSLAADVPLLHTYTSDITWSIIEAGKPGFLARGQFSADGCSVETMIRGQAQQHGFAPGRLSGIEVAELVMDAVEAANLRTPDNLRYTAATTQPPREIWDVNFGVPEDFDDSELSPTQAYFKSETTYEMIDGELIEISHTDYDPPRRAR